MEQREDSEHNHEKNMAPYTDREAGESATAEEEGLLMHDIEQGERPHHNATAPRPRTLLQNLRARLPAKFFAPATLRAVFNYPEPNMKLRSTAWLDGLRGLAAFEVFIFHYLDGWFDRNMVWGFGPYADSAWYFFPFLRTFYTSGDAAVCLFFAISGYVLSYKMWSQLRRGQQPGGYPDGQNDLIASLSSAMFRRAIRLYTPVMVETFILMFVCRYFGLPKPVVYDSAPTFLLELKAWFVSFLHLLLPLRYPDRWDALQDRYDGGISWTIPLEYYGSLYVYMSMLFLARVRSVTVRRCLMLMMVAQSFAKDDWIAAQFLMGMAFADYQVERQTNSQPGKSPRWPWLRPAWFWALFLLGFHVSGKPHAHMLGEYDGDYRVRSQPFYDFIVQPVAWFGLYGVYQTDRSILCLAAMCSIIGIGETKVLKKLLEIRFVQYLGRISFGLYLTHIFMRAWFVEGLGVQDGALRMLSLDPNVPFHERPASENVRAFVAFLLTMIPAAVANFIIAGLFERYLDRSSVRAGRAFETWCLSRNKGSSEKAGSVVLTDAVPMQERGVLSGNERVASQSLEVR